MSEKKIRVAIIGVGNCASSLVQGIEYYKNAAEDASVPGLMHVNLGGYHIRDIEFTLGIDINVTKVGKDLVEAIYADWGKRGITIAQEPMTAVFGRTFVALDPDGHLLGVCTPDK